MNPGTEETYIGLSLPGKRRQVLVQKTVQSKKERPKETTSQSFPGLSPHFNCNESSPLHYGREEQEYGKRKRILPILYSPRPRKDF